MKKTLVSVLLLAACLPEKGMARDLRDEYIFSTIDHLQGLSNSAVICLFKDQSELVWLGTYDGLNCFDGKNMEVFRADFSRRHTFNNNVIYGIDQADGDNLWISTRGGVNRFSKERREVAASYAVSQEAAISSNSRGDTWLVSTDSIAYYNTASGRFASIGRDDVVAGRDAELSFTAEDGTLWLFSNSGTKGEVYKISLDRFDAVVGEEDLRVVLSELHHCPIESVFYQSNVSMCFVDAEKGLWMYDTEHDTKVWLRNIAALTEKYGVITGIVPFYDDFVVAFRTNGLVRLESARGYREQVIDQNLRVFYLYKDPVQGVLWTGTDGKGAMMYTKRHSIATNLMMSSLSGNFTRQVRSILTDRRGGLWFGTKGDGLINVSDYAEGMTPEKTTVYFPEKRQGARTYTREDREFPVYSLTQSERFDGFWVGAGTEGIYRFDYGEGRLRHLDSPTGAPMNEVHEIYEAGDTLWVATTLSGFQRLILSAESGSGTGSGSIAVKSQKQYRFTTGRQGGGEQPLGNFFSILPQGDSVLWLGSRERGLVRLDVRTDKYRVVSLKEMTGRNVDDVLSLCRSQSGDIFVGTTAGLVRLRETDQKTEVVQYTGREEGLLNDMIHGILEDANGFLWLSTNRGLIKYDPGNGSSHAYYYSGGVQIGEFSDDAYYKCPYTGRLFFGGIDGLLYINENPSGTGEHYPSIVLKALLLGHDRVNASDYWSEEKSTLEIGYTGGSFSLVFAAPDYISAGDIEYSWMLEGYDNEFSPFGASGEATFTAVPPGNYLFRVKYRKDIFDNDTEDFFIHLKITPVWYQTLAAKILFALVVALVLAYFIYMVYRQVQNKRLIKLMLESEMRSVLQESVAYRNDELPGELAAMRALQAEVPGGSSGGGGSSDGVSGTGGRGSQGEERGMPAAEKKNVLVLEDHDEIFESIETMLAPEYNVHRVKGIQNAFEFIRLSPPIALIVDMTMYADAKGAFIEYVNRNHALLEKTALIPAFNIKDTPSLHRELMLIADSFFIMPYDTVFLREIVHKAVYGRKEAKQIRVEGIGDFADRISCTTREQADFIRRMVTVIEENIDREDLGSTFIAERMAISPRQFYRKFKDISGLPPTELIKNCRMERAAALLLEGKLSIQDIIAEVGIVSRSYFYKEFTRKFGMTPKEYREKHN